MPILDFNDPNPAFGGGGGSEDDSEIIEIVPAESYFYKVPKSVYTDFATSTVQNPDNFTEVAYASSAFDEVV